MSRCSLLVLILCTLTACASAAPALTQPTPFVTAVDPEEYALFSAMIDQNVVGFQSGGTVVILAQTSPDIDSLEMALEGPNQPPEALVEAYRLRNDRPYALDASFMLQRDYELVPRSEYDRALRGGAANWEEFKARYPQAEGVFLLSRAGLNAARDEALVSISYYCGSLCLDGGLFLMLKEDGVWRVEQELVLWMA